VFQYDEVYDSMEQSKTVEAMRRKEAKSADTRPKYIHPSHPALVSFEPLSSDPSAMVLQFVCCNLPNERNGTSPQPPPLPDVHFSRGDPTISAICCCRMARCQSDCDHRVRRCTTVA
jgi:hypothetical protein